MSLKAFVIVALGFTVSLGAVVLLAGHVPHWVSSGIVTSASGPRGEEFHVIQTYKGIGEPYQVTLFARNPGQKWTRTYLAHQDWSWSGCKIEVTGDSVILRGGDEKERTYSIKHLTESVELLSTGMAAEYTPDQLAERHNEIYRDPGLVPLG